MAEAARITVGAGVSSSGEAVVTLDLNGVVVVLDIYAAMSLSDLLGAKVGEAIDWHKLAHDPEAPSVLGMATAGSA